MQIILPKDDILTALNEFKFAISIEATNGFGRDWHAKVNQASGALDYLRKVADHQQSRINVNNGIVFFNNDQSYSGVRSSKGHSKIGLLMNIKQYDHRILEYVCKQFADSKDKKHSHYPSVLRIIMSHASDRTPLYDLLYPVHGDKPVIRTIKGKLMKSIRAEIEGKSIPNKRCELERYKDLICQIKGHIMEMYVEYLFKNSLERSAIFRRVNYYKDRNQQISPYEIDVLIAAYVSKFEQAVLTLEKNKDIELTYQKNKFTS